MTRTARQTVLAIDPGTAQSAWLVLVDGRPDQFGIQPNEWLLEVLRDRLLPAEAPDCIVIEKVEGTGMRVGAEVFETVFWTGRFAEAAHPLPIARIGRKAVAAHMCGSARANDADVRQALIDRFGGDGGKAAAVGLKATPGPLYALAKDIWQALAVAVTWADTEGAK